MGKTKSTGLALALVAAAIIAGARAGEETLSWDEPAAGVSIRGTMSFAREKDRLCFVRSPDGFPENRVALASARGEICGYLTRQRDGSRRSIYVHQVGGGGNKPSLVGRFLLDARVECPPDAIPCRVREPQGTRVVTMGTPGADSLLNDAIFLRETDTLVEFSAKGGVRIDTLAPGRFRVRLSGENDGEYAVRIEKDYFRSRNMPHYRPIDRRRAPHAPTGWMAWNIYFDQATAKDNLDEARAGAKHLKRFGLEYWSIESWQGNSDALPVANFHCLDLSRNEKQFPQGMKAVADEIRSIGFKPGLWIVPWGTGDKAFYEAHRSWFVHKPDGQPMSDWPGRYLLDITNDEAREHVRRMIRTYAEDWGYEFFKIDGMGIGLKMMRPEIWRTLAHPETKDPIYRWTHMFREAMGDRFYLAGTAALTSPGLEDCDATRIGGDIVYPNKPIQWENVMAQGAATLRRYYTHNIVAWNDPDTLMVDPKAMTMEEARVTTTIVGLPGQVMFSGDKLTQLPPERMRLIQTDLPVVDTRPMDLFPISDLRPVWNLAVKTPYQTWNVVALFNWGEKEQTVSATFRELGLDPEGEYALFETWENRWLGFAKDGFSVPVPPHAVRLVAVHPKSDRPILLSSDRHITRGAQDVESVAVDGSSLSFSARLVADHPVTLRFLLPDGWGYGGNDAGCSLEADGRILAVGLSSPKSEVATRSIRLVRSPAQGERCQRASGEADYAGRVVVRPEATREALINPGMGWVYYHFDNSNWNYGADTKPGDVLDWFPGCSTIYFRLPWRDLEPEEGNFRWDVIDSVAQPWIAAGKQIAFRFTCSESGYEFAVPEWLTSTGAKGGFYQMKRKGKDDPGRRVYEPDYLDPVFLAKFENFLAAAGRRWNGNPSVAFVDVGSFGMWGEGHTGFTSKIPPDKTREIAIVHARLHKKHFPDTPVIISDDVGGGGNPAEDDPVMAKMREIGVGFRDDSIMVAKRPKQWFHAGWARKFVKAGLPVMVESRHFFPPSIPEFWYEGGLLDSTVAYQASFQAIHWWPDELLASNRVEIEETNLRMGYRFVLKEASWPRKVHLGDRCDIGATWVNAGVAPPGEELVACWTLLDADGTVRWTSVDESFDFRGLPPTLENGETAILRRSAVRFGWDWPYNGDYYGTPSPEVRHDGTRTRHGPRVPTITPGDYTLCVSVGRRDGTPRIALPLKGEQGKTRRYRLGTITVGERAPLRCTLLPGGDVKLGEQLKVSVVSYPAKWKGKSAFPSGIRSPDAEGAVHWDLVKEGHKYGTGETRLWRRDDGSAACSFSVKMSEDLPCSGLVASFTIPAGLFAGSVWRDSKGHAVIAPPKFETLTLASGSVDWLELEMPNNDVRRLRISFPKARIINLQDDRQWGDTFTLRLYLSASDMLKKGNTYEQTFFVEGPAEIARQPIVRIAPGGDYVPLDFRKAIVPGSALDFTTQGFLDAPAGKHGWLRNVGGHFEYEGRPGVPCRFWGANLAIYAAVPSHEGAVLLLDTLARTGYNTIRIHNSERQFLKNSPDYLTLDEEQMEKFDFLFAEGKKRGFVFTTDLFIQRDSNWRALGVDRDGKVPWRDMKTLILVHDGAFENWKTFARNLLLRRNRYTGLTYAEDSAMPLLVLINEGWCEWNGRAFELEQTRARWKEWLAAKRAADSSAYPAAPEDCKGFRLDQASEASAVLRVFAGDMERSFCRRARDYLRSIGVKAMLSDWNCGPIIPEIQSAVSDELDYEDRHFYVDHPVFIRSGGIYSTSRNQSPVLSPRGHPGAGNVFRRVPGRPLTVSEWNHCGPSPYRAVGGLMTGAFAALRDWDILWHFNYAVTEKDAQYGQWRFDSFTIATDPWMIAMARMGGLLFMRREISPLPAAEAEAFDPLSLSGPVRFGQQAGREFMTVSTGRTAAGFARDGGMFAAGPLDCHVYDSQATVFASALEGERLEDSPRILLMHLTDLQTEGSSFKDGTYRTLLGWGYHRPLVRKGLAEVSLALARPGECEVWALETDGTRAERVPAKVIGDRLCFTMRVAPPAARIAYEICRVPRK